MPVENVFYKYTIDFMYFHEGKREFSGSNTILS